MEQDEALRALHNTYLERVRESDCTVLRDGEWVTFEDWCKALETLCDVRPVVQ